MWCNPDGFANNYIQLTSSLCNCTVGQIVALSLFFWDICVMDINCIIIDDERLLRESLAGFIEKYCRELTLVGKAAGAEEARKLLQEERVDVIFCDVHMPGENGFELLQRIDISKYHIVFVTAYNEYALQAIKAKAFDYLLKPVDSIELKKTVAALVASVSEKRKNQTLYENYRNALLKLFTEMKDTSEQPGKIAIHHASGILFVHLDDILFLEGDGAYTIVHLVNGKKHIATKILSEFEGLLMNNNFFRIHKSTIVNLEYVNEFSRGEGFSVILHNGVQLNVGRRRVKEVLQKFQHLAKNV